MYIVIASIQCKCYYKEHSYTYMYYYSLYLMIKLYFTWQVPVNAWWHRSMYSYTVVFADGSFIVCRINFDAKSVKIEKTDPKTINGK